jgi:ABC-type antimicrobial peptide transport system permease subunit
VTAVLLLARRELARRWRSALALTMLVGLVGAIVLAFAAGAHRSSSSLRRFVAYSRSSDMELDVSDPTAAQLSTFRRQPEVADFAVLHAFAIIPRRRPNLKNAATVDGRLGNEVDRARLVKGRFANPAAVDETVIGEGLAAQLHIGIGDELVSDSLSPAQLQLLFEQKNPGPPNGVVVRLHVVGIYRRPLDLGDLAASGGVVIETPAFDRAYQNRIALYTAILRVRTRGGAATVPQASDAARRIFGKQFNSVVDVSAEAHGAEDAINVLTLALWIFAGVGALAGAVAISIVMSRDLAQGEVDQSTLTAIGLTRRQRIAALGLRVLVIAAGGVLVATIASIALSPMFPIGIARRAEPNPGLRVDALVLGIGLASIAVFVALVGFLAAVRVSRSTAGVRVARGERPRRSLADLLARSGLRPPAANGVRMALEPGRGATAIPVRSAFLGAVFGVVGVTVVLVFASSLTHLSSSPQLYGWTWDFKAPDDTFSPGCGAKDYGLGAVPGVVADAAVCYQTGLPIDGRPTTGWGFTQIHGSIEPEIVAGRAPRGPDEVALGAATLSALHKKVGDDVTVRGPKASPTYHVVGQVVLSQLQEGDIQPLADGGAFTGAGFERVRDQYDFTRYLIGKIAPSADHAAVVRRVGAMKAFNAGPGQGAFVVAQGAVAPTRPPEVERLLSISWFPPLLALLVGVLALVAVGHALVTTAHRRRSELALLKTFGFRRRQVRATLAWQATTLAVVGLVVGIPIGVFIGHAVWRWVADSLGIATATIVPAVGFVLVIPGVILLVNVIAFWPARTASRTWPAVALSTE